jgi:spore maturation protein CgeB
VGAGAEFSTKDVETGYGDALQHELGPNLFYYDLASRLTLAQRWLTWLWTARGKDPERRPGWPEAIYRGSVEALELALRYEVDWVLVISGMFLHPDAVGLMRRAGLRTAVLFTESPYEDVPQAKLAGLVDMCWTTERTSVAALRQANPRTAFLGHAYDPARHAPAAADEHDVPAHDVVFVGTGFAERCELLERVDWTGIDLGLYGTWTLLGSRHKLRKFIRGGTVDNVRTAALYRRAKIGLNLYRSSRNYGRQPVRVQGAESLNPRAYELAACGVFQLSDSRAEVYGTFGWSVPTFSSAHELERLVREYLVRPADRAAATSMAQQQVAPHTFAARAAQVLADLESFEARPHLADRGEPAFAGQRGA